MARSFITFGDNGFYINDTFTELSLIYIIDIVERINLELPSWLMDMKKWWELTSSGATANMVDLRLDLYIVNEDRIALLSSFIYDAIEVLKKKGGDISVEEYNSYIDPTLKRFRDSPFPTDKIIKSLEHISDLINGKINYRLSDAVELPDF